MKTISTFVFSIFLLCVIISCNKDSATPILTNFSHFTLDLPSSWEERDYPSHEIGGLISNGTDSLYYDYGPFAYNSIDDLNTQLFDTTEHFHLEINGERAMILVGQRQNENRISYKYYIDKEDDFNRIVYTAYDLDDDTEIRKIIMTHKFL